MAERIDLPSKEKINETTDIVYLQNLELDIEAVCAKIEVDLSTLSDDPDWHARARSALAVHKMHLGWVRRRISRLTKGNGDNMAQYTQAQKAKAEKIEAKAENTRAVNRVRELNIIQAQISAQNRMTNLLEHVNYLNAFKKATHRHVEASVMEQILDTAALLHKELIEKELAKVKEE